MRLFFLTTLFCLSAFARLTDNQVEIKVDAQQLQLIPKKGFHLNAEAPASATFDQNKQSSKPEAKTEQLFAFTVPNKAVSANLSYYVCDDKKTVCERHQHSVNLKTGSVKVEAKVKEENKAIYNRAQDVQLASQNGKPTLIVFSAPWCPACLRMQTENFNQVAVKNELKKINFAKLNVDITDNAELSEKFGVRAIPTMVLLDKDGNETYRWLDFQAPKSFAAELKREAAQAHLFLETKKKAEMADAKAASVLGHRAFNAFEFEEALKWFSYTKSAEDLKYKLASEVKIAQQNYSKDINKEKDNYLQTLEKAMVLTTSELDRLDWSVSYLEAKKELQAISEESKAKGQEVLQQIDQLIAKPQAAAKAFKNATYGNYDGFEKEELLYMKDRVYNVLELKEEKDKNRQALSKSIAAKKLSVKRPGEMLMGIVYTRMAEDNAKAEAMYERLIKEYPHSYVYYEKYARFLLRNKNGEKALAQANEALKYPEGNLPQLSLLKANVLKEMNKKEEALTLIDQILKSDYVQHKKYAATVKRLNDLKVELKKQ